MTEQLNKFYEILNGVDDNLKLEDYKVKLLEIKELFKPKKEQEQQDAKARQEQQKENEINKVVDDILKFKRIKLSLIYNHYKYKLITKKQKEEVKDLLLNSNYINLIKNKNDKTIGYELNEDNKEEFKKWLIDNLISIN